MLHIPTEEALLPSHECNSFKTAIGGGGLARKKRVIFKCIVLWKCSGVKSSSESLKRALVPLRTFQQCIVNRKKQQQKQSRDCIKNLWIMMLQVWIANTSTHANKLCLSAVFSTHYGFINWLYLEHILFIRVRLRNAEEGLNVMLNHNVIER